MSCIESDWWEFPDGDFAWMTDPRDEVLASIDNCFPKALDVTALFWAFSLPLGIDQLAVCELIELGLIFENSEKGLQFTEEGIAVVRGRLAKRAGWADYCVLPEPKSLRPVGIRLGIAMLGYIDLHPDDWISKKFLEVDLSHLGLRKDERNCWITDARAH